MIVARIMAADRDGAFYVYLGRKEIRDLLEEASTREDYDISDLDFKILGLSLAPVNTLDVTIIPVPMETHFNWTDFEGY